MRTAPACWARASSERPASSIRSRHLAGRVVPQAGQAARRVRTGAGPRPGGTRRNRRPATRWPERRPGRREHGVEHLGHHGLDEQLLGGEAPVEGAHADPGPLGDDLHADIHTLLVEGGPGAPGGSCSGCGAASRRRVGSGSRASPGSGPVDPTDGVPGWRPVILRRWCRRGRGPARRARWGRRDPVVAGGLRGATSG